MPSIYNHENSCWGIRRSSCDMFQYDFSEELQVYKLTDRACRSDQNNATPDTSYFHYSISSNGYYGYQPHKAIQAETTNNDIEMDVEDASSTPSVLPNNDSMSRLGCTSVNSDLQRLARRKRQIQHDSRDSSKRIRQDGKIYL